MLLDLFGKFLEGGLGVDRKCQLHFSDRSGREGTYLNLDDVRADDGVDLVTLKVCGEDRLAFAKSLYLFSKSAYNPPCSRSGTEDSAPWHH